MTGDLAAIIAAFLSTIPWLLTAAMLAVIVLDTTRYVIPNSLNLALLVLWGMAAFFLPLNPLMALAAAGLVLLVGLGFFALGLMGGGDIKLLVVLTLWLGWSITALHFLMLTAIVGGALVIVLLLLRAVAAMLSRGRELPRILMPKQPVPYGIAIALAFLLLLWRGSIPALA